MRVWIIGSLWVLSWPGVTGFPQPLKAESQPKDSLSVSAPLVGVVQPGKISVLATVQSARIARIPVMEGQDVSSGDVVCLLDDGVQRARTEAAKAEAESEWDIHLAKARLERAERDLERLSNLHGVDFASSKELSDARADVEIARLEHGQARFAHEQAQRIHVREHETLDQFSIRAPFPAYVASLHAQIGEVVEVGDPVVTLVQLDPLEVGVDCPLHLAAVLRAGGKAMLRPFGDVWPPRMGSIVVAERVADAASQTFKVKLSVSNSDAAWVSGIKVFVEFLRDDVDGATVTTRKTTMGAVGPLSNDSRQDPLE